MSKVQTMDVQVRELRELVHGRDVQISTLKQHLALLTSDFKYNLKLLEDRDFELDQCEAHLAESDRLRTQKIKEIDLLVLEIGNLRSIADRDKARIQELETTLSQYKESVRSVRERLEEALQLRDQELTCHRSELEVLQTKLLQQAECFKVQEKSLGDSMKACERTWSQRYSECHKTVMTLVAEQDSLLKEKLDKDKEMENLKSRASELQNAIDELTRVADVRRKECVSLTDQLEAIQGKMTARIEELEHEKQELEGNMRKKILEEYDGKIAELLAQLQSIEYAVSLERREAHTRFVSKEAQHARQISVLHQTIQDLRRERDVILAKAVKLEKEVSSLKEVHFQLRNRETRLSDREATLTNELSTLQDSLHQAQTLLEKSEVEKTHEISLLHEFLREARSKEHVLSKREEEHVKRINTLEKLLVEAKAKVVKMSKRESEQEKELIALRESFNETKSQKEIFFQKNGEYLKEITSLKKSLLDARNQAEMFSRKHTENVEEFANLQQRLIEARNHNDMMSQKNEENTKDIAGLKHILREAKSQENLMRRKLEDQAKQIEDLQESFYAAKAEGELLLKAEAAHAEEICALRASLIESQRQADASRKRAKHLDAMLEATQTEVRQRVEVKEGVSCLLTGTQDVQALEIGQESTTLEYPAPNKCPGGFSGVARIDRIENSKAMRSCRDSTQEFEEGLTGDDHRPENFAQAVTHRGEPHHVLEKENEFLKARVEELETENLKVGQVISDLRYELETVGVLQRLEGLTTDATSNACMEHNDDKVETHVVEAPAISGVRQRQKPSDPEGKTRHVQMKGSTNVTPPEQETISLAEKEELQMLRSMMRDVHDRNARFYTKVESMNFTDVKPPRNVSGKAESTCPPHSPSDGNEGPEDRHKHRQPSQNHHGRNSSSHTAGTSRNLVNRCGRSQGNPPENQSALTVSAEVLKLNEQIARVRQQLTSLCSTDQTDPSPSPTIVDKMRPQARPGHFPNQLCTYEETAKAERADLTHKMNRVRSTTSLHQNDPCEHGKESLTGALKQPPQSMHPKRKPHLDWADVGHVLIGKSSVRSPEYSTAANNEVMASRDRPIGKNKAVLLPCSKPSIKDSAKIRPKVGKKLQVRVPSVASSRSDVVCAHCRRCMTDEEVEEALHRSTSELSCSPSPDLQRSRQSQPSRHEPRHWQSVTHGRRLPVDSSTGSEEREAIDISLQSCQKKSKASCVVLPEPAGRWSDNSDDSGPSGRTALSIRRARAPSLHPNSRVPPKRPWAKTGDKRGVQQQEADKGVARAITSRDDIQVSKKSSGSILRKNAAADAVVSKTAKKGKAFPANLRENIYSHQPEMSQFRVSVAHHPKTNF